MKQHVYRVRGRGRFPIDMLRVGHAWPATTRDADRVAMSLLLVSEPRKTYEVTLCATLLPGTHQWALAGWEVL